MSVLGCRQAGKNASIAGDYFTLDNGLDVSLLTVDGAEQSCLLILYDMGDRSDPPGQSGLAHLAEHLYVTSATEDLPSRTMMEFVAAYPLGWNAQIGDDYTVIATVFEPGALTNEIVEAAARMRQLKVNTADLERERPRIEIELNSMYGGPPSLAFLNHGRHFAAPLPNAGRRSGKMDEIKALSVADLQARFDQYYKPVNAHLVLLGDFDPEPTGTLVRKTFGSIVSGERVPNPPPMNAPVSGTHEIEYLKGIDVGVTYRAPETDHPLYPAFLLLATHLRASSFTGDGPEVQVRYTHMYLDDPRSFHLRTGVREGEEDRAAAQRLRSTFAADVSKTLSAQQLAQTKSMLSVSVSPDEIVRLTRGKNPYRIAFTHARLKQMGWEAADLAERVDQVEGAHMKEAVETFFVPENEVLVVGRVPVPAGSVKE